jgi:hypothetical protein
MTDTSSVGPGERSGLPWPGGSEQDGPRSRRIAAAVAFLLTFLPLSVLTHRNVFPAGNDASRFAQIEALVDYREPYIDHSRYRRTVDRVEIGGHSYSNKPPVLALAGTAVYAVLKTITGWTFRSHEGNVVRTLVILLVALPTACLVSLFYLALAWHPRISRLNRWLTTAALAWGTILTSFSVTLNNHTVAAALLFAAVVAACRGRAVWAGLWAGLTVCVDAVPGLIIVPILLWIVHDTAGRRGMARSLIVFAGCAVLFLLADWIIVGSLLPPKLVPGGIDRSSSFGKSAGGVLLPERWTYPVECLVGGHGFFSVSPVLIFGAIGLYLALRRPLVLSTRWCWLIAAGVGLQILSHIVLAGSYGGWSYGFRYLIPVVPLLLFFAPAVLTRWRTRAFAPVLVVSVLFALLGVYNPWPPGYEQESAKNVIASQVTNPVGGNAAAWLEQHFPGSAAAVRAGTLFISGDPGRRRAYYAYFFASKGDLERMQRYKP